MPRDGRLKWVQANRTRRGRTRSVGPLISGLVERGPVASVEEALAAAGAIAAVMDDEFRAHCRVTVPDKRTLVINVDSAALVYPIRLRWLSRLQEQLSSSGGKLAFANLLAGVPAAIGSHFSSGAALKQFSSEPCSRRCC